MPAYSFLSVTETVTMSSFRCNFSSKMLWSSSKEVFLTANGETIGVDSLILEEKNSTEGLYIKQVKYFFDSKELCTVSIAPYNFSCSINNEKVGEHKFSFEITYCEKNGTEHTSNTEYNVTVMPESLNIDDALFIGDNTERVTDKTDIMLSNDDNLTGHLELLGSNVNAKIKKVEYYFDGKLISASSIEPYSFNYDLSKVSAGKYKFTRVVYIDSDYGELTVGRVIDVTIK